MRETAGRSLSLPGCRLSMQPMNRSAYWKSIVTFQSKAARRKLCVRANEHSPLYPISYRNWYGCARLMA